MLAIQVGSAVDSCRKVAKFVSLCCVGCWIPVITHSQLIRFGIYSVGKYSRLASSTLLVNGNDQLFRFFINTTSFNG